MYNVQCKLTRWTPHCVTATLMEPLNATDSSLCTYRLSSLACLTSVCSDRLPSCSLWRHCSLAPNAICLSHSVDSLALNYMYTVRSPPSWSIAQNILKSFSTCANLKCTCTFVKLYMATSKQTYTRFLQCSHASVGLAQARPNYTYCLVLYELGSTWFLWKNLPHRWTPPNKLVLGATSPVWYVCIFWCEFLSNVRTKYQQCVTFCQLFSNWWRKLAFALPKDATSVLTRIHRSKGTNNISWPHPSSWM